MEREDEGGAATQGDVSAVAMEEEAERELLRHLRSSSGDLVQPLRQAQTQPHFGRSLARLLLRAVTEETRGREQEQEDTGIVVLPAQVKFAMANALLEHIRAHWHEPELQVGGVIGSDDRRVIRECLLDAIFSQPLPGADTRVVQVLRICVQRAWESDCHVVPPCKTFLDRVVATISSVAASDRYQPAVAAASGGDAAAAATVDAGSPTKEAKGKEKALDVEQQQQQLRKESGPEEKDDHILEQALIMLYHLNKHFQYRTAFNAVKLEIVEHVMPILLRLFAGLMEDRSRLERHTIHLQYLLKSYWALSRMAGTLMGHRAEQQQKWNEQISVLINITLPFERWDVCPPEDALSPAQAAWWKCKRYSWSVLTRYKNRRGRKREPGLDSQLQALTKICLHCLHEYCAKRWKLSDAVVVALLTFLLNCLAPKDTRAMMLEGYADQLIDDLVSMCQLMPAQLELFNRQPIAYLRQEYDLDNVFMNAGSVAKNLLSDVLHDEVIFEKILARIESGLNSDDVLQKDAALAVLGYIYFREDTCASAARLLTQHVLPIARDPTIDVLLRARACYAVNGVSRVFIGYTRPTQEIAAALTQATEVMLECMKDEAVAVKFYATMALSQLVHETLDTTPVVMNSFPWILESIIKLVEEVGNDELIPALNSLVSYMSLKQITEYAVVLCKHLMDAFNRVAAHALNDDNSAMLALGCLGALCGVLDTLFNMKTKDPHEAQALRQQVAAVAGLLVPWLNTLFTDSINSIVEFVEEVMRILTYLTFHIVPNPEELFTLFVPLCQMLTQQDMLDWVEELSIPLGNFIANGTVLFLSDKSNIEHYYQACSVAVNYAIQRDLSNTMVVRAYCRMVSELFEHCKEHPGSIDGEVDRFLQLVVRQIPVGNDHEIETKGHALVWILSAVAHALYYNPTLTVQCLAQHEQLDAVFSLFYDHSDVVLTRFVKSSVLEKVFVAGFCRLLATVQASTPPQVTKSLLPFLLRLLNKYQEHAALKARKRQMQMMDDEMDMAIPSDEYEGLEEDEDDENDEVGMEDEDEGEGLNKRKRTDTSGDLGSPAQLKKKKQDDDSQLTARESDAISDMLDSFADIEEEGSGEAELNRIAAMLSAPKRALDLQEARDEYEENVNLDDYSMDADEDALGVVESPTPMTAVDVFATFYTAVQELQTSDLHTYHMLSALLNGEDQRLMDGFLQLGAERRQGIKSLKQMCVQSICNSPTLYAKAEQEAECLPATVWSDVQAYRQVTSQSRPKGGLLTPRAKPGRKRASLRPVTPGSSSSSSSSSRSGPS